MFDSPDKFIIFLGSTQGIGWLLSFVQERSSLYQKLSPSGKQFVNGLLCVGLPLLALAAQLYVPPEFWITINPWFAALVVGMGVWLGSQVGHAVDRKLIK